VIAVSVALGEQIQTPLHYQKYIDLLPTTSKIESIMAAHYYKTKQYGRSLPHMRKALSLDPNSVDAARFEKILVEYGNPSSDEYEPD
jgi:hypothetical protein